jgi:hypothetical protein
LPLGTTPEADPEVGVVKCAELQQHEQHGEHAHQNGEEGQQELPIVHWLVVGLSETGSGRRTERYLAELQWPTKIRAVIEAADRVGRQCLRDQVLLRLIYRHGLRALEAKHTKLKGSIDSVHTLDRDEVSALRKVKAASTLPFVFVSERGGPLSSDMIARIVERAGQTAKLGFHVHCTATGAPTVVVSDMERESGIL